MKKKQLFSPINVRADGCTLTVGAYLIEKAAYKLSLGGLLLQIFAQKHSVYDTRQTFF